ncbi:MAG TPA: hypothetical protein VKI45_02625 [Allosphingosinicella sp.]|nr:hypothetical protein [Allosphingosinicella sp.]
MTQDARNSLTALVVVSAGAIFFYAVLQIEHRYPLADWLSRTLNGIGLALLFLALAKAGWRRWRRAGGR